MPDDVVFARRTLLKIATAGAASAIAPSWAFAGPFRQSDFEKLIPVDKKLSPEWIASLTARGVPSSYRGDALQHIGMPVGGLCCGLVYLSGDGRLWLWDIFNSNVFGIARETVEYRGTRLDSGGGAAYVMPPKPHSPFAIGVTLKADGRERAMDSSGWSNVVFTGQYPVGRVDYRDTQTTLEVHLDAFSPFIPLDHEDSSLPVTVLRYTITNTGNTAATGELIGHLENPVCMDTASRTRPQFHNREFSGRELTGIECSASPLPREGSSRPDLVVDDFQHDGYGKWKVEGTAFGSGPVRRSAVPAYQGNLGGPGRWVVNSHAAAPASDVNGRDAATGKLTSPEFKIERKNLNFWIGGGNHPGKTCLNLVVEGKTVLSATGHDSNEMRFEGFDVTPFQGKVAQIEIVDAETGAWGHIGVGPITQSDRAPNQVEFEREPDFGTMALAALGPAAVKGLADSAPSRPVGTVAQSFQLAPAESKTLTFLVSWHFANVKLGVPDDSSRRHYAKRFKSAREVAGYVATRQSRLFGETERWRKTWYDDTSLPHWFMERTMANTSTLATTTAHRFGSGRFYAWEGVGCCAGTCVHVWHYAQAMGRLFPALERVTREKVDFGLGFNKKTGEIGFRAEFDRRAATDGQAGTICRVLREHQMSPDSSFLKRVWPQTKQAIEYLIRLDGNADGIIEGPQENTLDAAWYGKNSWISSLYLAALAAGAELASKVDDHEFASRCKTILEAGRKNIQALFNGEYYIQTRDPAHPNALGSYDCCHIDQVFGQSWAFQVGLGRVLPKEQTLSALKSLWKYNFTPNVGPYRDKMRPGRWYAMPGDGGMIMTTNPREVKDPFGDPNAWQVGYFNECMSGFEHQVASHMIAEGMVTEGLAVIRAIHDRYGGNLRNPWNEIECSDHYARAMASYGAFISMTGFEHDGPAGFIGFDPKVGGEVSFPFVACEGWGAYRQTATTATLKVEHGWLRLKSIRCPVEVTSVSVGGRSIPFTKRGRLLDLANEVVLRPGDLLVAGS